MLMFSVIFLGIGLLFEFIGIGMVFAMIMGEMDFNFLVIGGFVLMPIIFIFIGAVSLIKYLKERKENTDIRKNGRKTYAKVIRVEDTAGIMVNGMMPHGVIVRYFDSQGRINNDMIKVEPEDKHYGTVFEGETLEIAELDGQCVLIRELENLSFEGSEILIDPTVSVYGEGVTSSVNCPVCGAIVNAARGGAAFCSHCGYKVRLSAEGKIENP